MKTFFFLLFPVVVVSVVSVLLGLFGWVVVVFILSTPQVHKVSGSEEIVRIIYYPDSSLFSLGEEEVVLEGSEALEWLQEYDGGYDVVWVAPAHMRDDWEGPPFPTVTRW